MKKKQHDPVYKLDDFEDLTLYANESFDTQDVDLFEFSSEESSPLMQLKSIILSLDWEINDEILQELADELEKLESSFQNDKVAEVYLQGLHKLGGYIRTKGAYAHPNSIKLLLTFFYNFEKIISSPNITEEEITQLLTGDVRKFRILQYQINQTEEEPASGSDKEISETAASPVAEASLPAQTGPAKQLKAAILSLDWEVTDESLRLFNTSLAPFHGMFADNKPALVLVQGLQVLCDYISEKRAGAHPEAFLLLHSFYEALEQFVAAGEQPLDQSKIHDLLVDRVNRIDNLKMLVAAQTTSSLDAHTIDKFVDEISSPIAVERVANLPPTTPDAPIAPALFLHADLAKETKPGDDQADDLLGDTFEAEIDALFAMDTKPAMETADVQYPDEILPPDAIHPVDDELADDFIEASLSSNRGLMPALSDTDEISGFNEAAQPLDLSTQQDLADQLDFLFPEADTDTENLPGTPPAMDFDIAKISNDDENQPVAALADVIPEDVNKLKELAFSDMEEPIGDTKLWRQESEITQSALDIQSKLDDFFAEPPEIPAESVTATRLSVEDNEHAIFFDKESGVESALADSSENHGFSEEEVIAKLDYTPMGEIEEKLDFFFGADADVEPLAAKLPEPASENKDSSVASDDSLDKELEGALDFFFDANEDDEETFQPAADELTQALEATIDNRLIAPAFAQEELRAASLPAEARQIQLAALGALLPGVVLTMSREKAAESTQLIATLNNLELSSGQQTLAQLLNSVISLLVRLPKRNEDATEKLVNYLYEHLLEDQCQPEILLEAVNRFTAWLLDTFAIMPPVQTDSGQENEPHFEYTAKELYFELSELRGHINEEFAKLRHELHHKH